MKKTKNILFALLAASCLFACEYATIQPEEVAALDPAVEVVLSADIYPFFEDKKCGACHLPEKGYNFKSSQDTYTTLTTKSIIDETNMDNSKLLTSFGTSGYHSSMGVTDTEIKALSAKLELWVAQGKKNN